MLHGLRFGPARGQTRNNFFISNSHFLHAKTMCILANTNGRDKDRAHLAPLPHRSPVQSETIPFLPPFRVILPPNTHHHITTIRITNTTDRVRGVYHTGIARRRRSIGEKMHVQVLKPSSCRLISCNFDLNHNVELEFWDNGDNDDGCRSKVAGICHLWRDYN